MPLLLYFPVTYLLLSSLYIRCSRWPSKKGRAGSGSGPKPAVYRYGCHSNEFGAKLAKWPSFSTRHFKTEWNIAIWISSCTAPMIPLHHVQIWWTVTPEIEVWEFCTFETIRQKLAYLTEYVNNYWTDFHRFSFGRGMYADYKSDISFAVSQETLLCNQLILEDFGRRQNWPSSLFALVFEKEVHYRLAGVYFCCSSCKKMAKIGFVVFELKLARKLCCDLADSWLISFIWHTGVLKRIGISQFGFRQVNRQSLLYI